jgi:hypothetical protein
MPTANIYCSDKQLQDSLIAVAPALRKLLAEELTCGARALAPNEISIRVLSVAGNGKEMIAPIEIEIMAHAYQERIVRVDKICLIVRDFVRKEISSAPDVRVWLVLAELGHSWEE